MRHRVLVVGLAVAFSAGVEPATLAVAQEPAPSPLPVASPVTDLAPPGQISAPASDGASGSIPSESAAAAAAPEATAGPAASPAPVAAPAGPAPMRMQHGAKLFIEPSEFGMALSAALLKKRVGVVGLTDREKADFFVQTASTSSKEGGGERVAKVLMFGAFAGSGKRFEATVTITNRDGAIIFAHNSKKENFQSAAENIAKEIGKHLAQR